MKEYSKNRHNNYLLLLIPASIFLFLVIVYPTIYMWYMSSMDWTPLQRRFVGIGNYIKLIRDPVFWKTLWNTAYLSFGALIIEFILGFIIAIALNREFIGKGFVLWIIMIPMVVPPVVVGLTFRMLYDPSYGMINYLLSRIGIRGIEWLTDPSLAMPAIILADVWNWTPFITLILLSGLQYMSKDVIESAQIDGASGLEILFKITIPLLKPLITLAVVFRFINVIRTFDLIYMTTRGGPGIATQTLPVSIFLEAFDYMKYGYASTQSIVLFFFVFAMVIALRKFFKDELV